MYKTDDYPFHFIPAPLLLWYRGNKRALPWRENPTPYRVWVSEIMLQQTRVEAAREYYLRFMRELPDVYALASCEEDRLMKLWEGLGYYSRARNLQKAARIVAEEYGGKFPEDEKGLRALPGVGEYTAGAVLSIAFGKRAPAVDGNVLRVMSRLTADPSPVSDPAYKGYLSERLKEIYPPEGEGCSAFTQSLMELGALVCKPLSPDCPVCPLRSLCRAAERGEQGNFPVLPEKKQKRREEIFVFLIRTPDGIAVRKRTSGVLKGMYEFPSLPASDKSPEQILSEWGMSAFTVGSSRKYTHIFTHIRWEMTAFPVRAPAAPFEIYPEGDIEAKISLPTAFRQCLNRLPEENGAGRGEPSAKSKRRAADRTEDETDEKRTKTKHAGKEKEI